MYYKGKASILKKEINSFNLLLFGLGNILGPQIFVMLTTLILLTGIYGIFSILLCSLISFFVAMIFSELSLSMPIAGLVINSVSDAFGGFMSFLIGWSQVLGNVTFAAFCAIGFGILVGYPYLGGVGILALVTLLEFTGVSKIEKVQNAFVIVILIFFVSIIALNFNNVTAITEISFLPFEINNLQKIFLGVGFFFLAFTGFEDLPSYSEELKNIKRLPSIMFLSIAIVSSIFILLYLLLIGSINDPLLLENPLLFLSQKVYGNLSGRVFLIVGILASVGSLMTTLSTISRNIFSMSEKRYLPKNLYEVTKNGTPFNAIVLSSIFIGIVILIRSVEILAYLANFVYFFMVFFVAWSLLRLRQKRKLLKRPFKVPFYPILPYLTALFMLALMFFLNVKSLAIGFIWLFFGFLLYMLRIVGENRVKLAAVGGNLIISVIIVFVLVVLHALYPDIFQSVVVIFVVTCFLISILFMSFVALLDVLKTRYLHQK